jgi:hypothetical protein
VSPTEEARRARKWSRTTTFLALYIAIAVTVLGIMILNSVGTNASQSKRIASQARVLAEKNATAALKGCYRGNYVREKINVISGALTSLLERSVTESEKIKPLTPSQEEFLGEEYRKLKPLKTINCRKRYGDAPKSAAPQTP